jgi:hypothetical protein
LPRVARATHPPRRFSGRLNCRQQQPHQNPDDGDHNQQFNQRKTALAANDPMKATVN